MVSKTQKTEVDLLLEDWLICGQKPAAVVEWLPGCLQRVTQRIKDAYHHPCSPAVLQTRSSTAMRPGWLSFTCSSNQTSGVESQWSRLCILQSPVWSESLILSDPISSDLVEKHSSDQCEWLAPTATLLEPSHVKDTIYLRRDKAYSLPGNIAGPPKGSVKVSKRSIRG